MNTNTKLIQTLEEALVLWSNLWGNSLSEHSMNRAEQQIHKINRQLAELKASR